MGYSELGSTASITRSEEDAYEKLFDVLDTFATDQRPIIKVNPCHNKEEFNNDEQFALSQRDFRTRAFFSNNDIDGVNAWIRTHHTDVGKRPHIDYVREYFMAAFENQHVAAKSTLTGILDTIFSMELREYYNFATIMASCLSVEAQHTTFEMSDVLTKDYKSMMIARTMAQRRFTLLMNIVFGKVSAHRFLKANGNIYRLVYCQTKGSKYKSPIFFVIFSFCLQACMGYFVVSQVLQDTSGEVNPELQYGLYFLAALGSIFGIVSTLPDIINAKTIFAVYGNKIGPIYVFDVIINVLIPLFLAVVGFRLVTLQQDYINGVIMTTALLFIPEIDDQLPGLLGLDLDAIIENHLLYEAKLSYEEYSILDDNTIATLFRKADVESQSAEGPEDCKFGVNFSDYFLTNSVMEGSDAHDFSQPFNIKKQTNNFGHELDPSNFVTSDCLVSKIEWRYLDSSKISPTIGYLRLTKLNGEVIEIDFSEKSEVERGEAHQLQGCFLITNFVITATEIESLRLAGTENGRLFLKAMDHYSLWSLTADATSLLKRKFGR